MPTKVRVCQREVAHCHISSIKFLLFRPDALLRCGTTKFFISLFYNPNFLQLHLMEIHLSNFCIIPQMTNKDGWKHNVLNSCARYAIPAQRCCPWSACEDYCISYHRDVQSSHFKRHLCLIAWLSINPDWIKRLSSVSPPCFPSALSVSPPSPSLHHSNHTRISNSKAWKSSRENLLPSITDADEKSKLSGAA